MSAERKEVFIQGVTKDGQTFRPSDWAERLAGAMSCFRPGGSRGGISSFIGYSPYCVPRVINGVKCVIVNEALRKIEPMAWDFVMNFARDNNLQVAEACLLPTGERIAAGGPGGDAAAHVPMPESAAASAAVAAATVPGIAQPSPRDERDDRGG